MSQVYSFSLAAMPRPSYEHVVGREYRLRESGTGSEQNIRSDYYAQQDSELRYRQRRERVFGRYSDMEKEQLIHRITSLNMLEINWDGYNARPISIPVIKDAVVFLAVFPKEFPLPKLSYSADDEILLYWEMGGDRYDLSFYGDSMIYAYRRAVDSEEDYLLLPFPIKVSHHLSQMGV